MVGLEHLPVPAPPAPYRPNMSKDHLQIADESELRGEQSSMASLYNSLQPPTSQGQGGMGKLAMDISNINQNPFFHINSHQGPSNDDIILLQTAEDHGRGHQQSSGNGHPDIIPISFGDTVPHPQGYQQQDKISLVVGEGGEVSDHQYRIIPEMMPDGGFHEETIDSCLSIFPGCSDPHELSPVKSQESHGQHGKARAGHMGGLVPHATQGQVVQGDLVLPITGNHNSFQALFDAATSEYEGTVMLSRSSTMAPSSLSTTHTLTTTCTTPSRMVPEALPKPVMQGRASDCAVSENKKMVSPGKSMSQGKLRVINQGIQSENIQSPSLAETRNKARRRSGQASGFSSLTAVPPLCPSASPSLHPAPPPPPAVAQLPRSQAGVRLLSVGAQDGGQEEAGQIVSQESSSENESEAPPSPHGPSLSTPGLVNWPAEELWRTGGAGWTHPVESVDTAVPTSGAVWQLPTSQGTSLPNPWNLPPIPERLALGGQGLPEPPALSLIPPSCSVSLPRSHPSTIPWNTPVSAEDNAWPSSAGGPSSGAGSVGQHAPRDTPPGLAVSWTQPQTSASPSPAGTAPQQQAAAGVPHQPAAAPGSLATDMPPAGPGGAPAGDGGPGPGEQAGPSWRNNFGDDNMLAIRSGIPLALQNKAIRSGVPIGPFQTKRKRKSRASLDGAGRTRKRPSVAGKRGDLEVRKDLTIESQRREEEAAEQAENVFQNDDSRPSTSNIVSKTKEETNIATELGVSSPIGGVHIKTVKSLNELSPSPAECSELHGESSKADKLQFSCVNCSMMFASAGQLKRHTQNVHEREETLFCQVCPERCQGKENLKLHLYKTHGMGEIFRCEECNYESPMKSAYIKHLGEHIPQEDKKKKCPKCEKVFKTKTGLNMHLKQHFDEALFSCLSCDFKTPQKLNLVKHTASKHGEDVEGKLLEMNVACELCDFKCIAEHMLKNHVLRKHTTKAAMRFPCSLCSYATVEKAALDKHMRFKHTNERPFMCDTCGFSTHTASAMARHKRSHSNTKPHKCEICGHEYADRKRLRDHMYLHSDHKPFNCQMCSYTCRRKDNLTAHMKKQHSVSKLETVEEKKNEVDERKEESRTRPDSTSTSPSPSSLPSTATSNPPSLPTIAMADIAVPFSHSVDVASRHFQEWQEEVVVLPHPQEPHHSL